MVATHRAHDSADDIVLSGAFGRDPMAIHEMGHHGRVIGQERVDLGADAQVGRNAADRVLAIPLDPKKVGAYASHAQYETGFAASDEVVEVGDSSFKWMDLVRRDVPTGHSLKDSLECVVFAFVFVLVRHVVPSGPSILHRRSAPKGLCWAAARFGGWNERPGANRWFASEE